LTGIIADPTAAGLDDVSTPCLAFSVTPHAICSNPSSYLFWDGTHPTSAGHRLVANAAATALGGQ
jgi:phospholipase/lecithinase/hemolysin